MKTIPYDQYLRSVGLFVMAAQHYTKAQEFNDELNKTLGLEDGSRIEDLLFRSHTLNDYDKALRKEGIEVEGK